MKRRAAYTADRSVGVSVGAGDWLLVDSRGGVFLPKGVVRRAMVVLGPIIHPVGPRSIGKDGSWSQFVQQRG